MGDKEEGGDDTEMGEGEERMLRDARVRGGGGNTGMKPPKAGTQVEQETMGRGTWHNNDRVGTRLQGPGYQTTRAGGMTRGERVTRSTTGAHQ